MRGGGSRRRGMSGISAPAKSFIFPEFSGKMLSQPKKTDTEREREKGEGVRLTSKNSQYILYFLFFLVSCTKERERGPISLARRTSQGVTITND